MVFCQVTDVDVKETFLLHWDCLSSIEPLYDEDVVRAAELMGIYRDAPLGFVDASIVAQAERLGIVSLLTTDRRHFSLVRPRHISSFRLEP